MLFPGVRGYATDRVYIDTWTSPVQENPFVNRSQGATLAYSTNTLVAGLFVYSVDEIPDDLLLDSKGR